MNKNVLGLAVVVLGLSACTWVKPTEEGDKVILVQPFNVTHCKKLGSTTSTVKHAIGPINRSQEKVTEELVTIARNEAARMGGDSIVAKGEAQEGSMSFDVYQCAADSPDEMPRRNNAVY